MELVGKGRSPRLRGVPPLHNRDTVSARTIPAPAGLTALTRATAPLRTDHPLPCGAYIVRQL